jgi:hypothetical protein
MAVLTRKLRIALSTAATVTVLPAAILALAGTAHATDRGLNVSFKERFGGIEVTVGDAVGAGNQQCTYDAHPESDSLIGPSHKDFKLPSSGSTSFTFPGIATGTLYRVHIECSFDPPNPFAKPGLFDDTQQY